MGLFNLLQPLNRTNFISHRSRYVAQSWELNDRNKKSKYSATRKERLSDSLVSIIFSFDIHSSFSTTTRNQPKEILLSFHRSTPTERVWLKTRTSRHANRFLIIFHALAWLDPSAWMTWKCERIRLTSETNNFRIFLISAPRKWGCKSLFFFCMSCPERCNRLKSELKTHEFATWKTLFVPSGSARFHDTLRATSTYLTPYTFFAKKNFFSSSFNVLRKVHFCR